MTLSKPLAYVTVDDLQSLVVDKVAEKQTVDYKQTIKLDIPQNKDEFRRDISSFANASGGDYILGIREEQGLPVDIGGMPLNNPDGFKLRLEELLQSHIRPRIPGVQIQPIEMSEGIYVTIVRVPRSFARPHQITINKDDFQFWSRNSASKYRLDVDQLRSAFLLSETLEERIRNFRRERLGDIIAGQTPVPMSDRPKLVFHLVPLDAFEASVRYDLSHLSAGEINRLWPIYTSSLNTRFNFDGILNFHEQSGVVDSYVQLFRNGIVEAVEDDTLTFEQNGQRLLRTTLCERELLAALPKYIGFQRSLGVESPIIVMLSLLGVKGCTIPSDQFRFHRQSRAIDRDALIIPEVVVEQGDIVADMVLRPLFDTIWNALGQSHCPNYDADGKWHEK